MLPRTRVLILLISTFVIVFLSFYVSASPSLQSDQFSLLTQPKQAYAAVDRSIFQRRDLIYGTQVGAWELDGGSAVNDPVCKAAVSDAAIKTIRWQMWDDFVAGGGTITTTQFNTGLNGIIDTGAVPLMSMPPIYDEQCVGGTKPWNEDWIKRMIQTAGSRVSLYEFGNEPDNYCGWDTDLPGDGQYAANWIATVPDMKKYARTLGHEIFVGGPSRANTNNTSALLINNFLQDILDEYNNPASTYYRDTDLLPDFISFHAYYPDCTVAWDCTDITQFPSRFDLAIDEIRSQSAFQSVESLTNRDLPLAITEWNFTASDSGNTETKDDNQTLMNQYMGGMLKMFRIKNIWMANRFTFSSHSGTAMDMMTNTCTAKPAYNAFKTTSLADAATSYAAPTVGNTYQATILGDDALGYWRLGESASGSAATDSAGGRNGTYTNAPTLGQTGALIDNADTSVQFTGANSTYVSIPYTAALNPNTFTVETWVYPTGGSGYRAIASSRTYPLGWVLYQTDTNRWSFWINDDGGGGDMVALDGGAVTPNTWTHLVATYDGTTARLYVNNEEVSATGVNFSPNTSSVFTIGQGTPGDNFFFTGKIDEFAFYDQPLTDTQIDNHYTQATVRNQQATSSTTVQIASSTQSPNCSLPAPHSAPNLFQIDASDTGATLYYSPAAGEVNRYAVIYGYGINDNRFGVEYPQANSTGVLSYTINALSPNTKYALKIQAVNSCIGGAWSEPLNIKTAPKGSKVKLQFYKSLPNTAIKF